MGIGVTKLRDVKRELSQGLDDPAYAAALRAIRRCRSRADLDALVDSWLTPPGDARLKLVRHGVGTYMVVRYEDGWTSRLSMTTWRER